MRSITSCRCHLFPVFHITEACTQLRTAWMKCRRMSYEGRFRPRGAEGASSSAGSGGRRSVGLSPGSAPDPAHQDRDQSGRRQADGQRSLPIGSGLALDSGHRSQPPRPLHGRLTRRFSHVQIAERAQFLDGLLREVRGELRAGAVGPALPVTTRSIQGALEIVPAALDPGVVEVADRPLLSRIL